MSAFTLSCGKIPAGQVATYGQVAELAGLIGKPRPGRFMPFYRVDMKTSDVTLATGN